MARVSVFQFWFNGQTITWTFVKLTVIRLTLFCVPNMFSRELILLLVFIKKYTYISPKLKLLLTTVFSPVLHLIDKPLDTFFYSLHRFFSHNDHLLDQEIQFGFCSLTNTFFNAFSPDGAVWYGQNHMKSFTPVFPHRCVPKPLQLQQTFHVCFQRQFFDINFDFQILVSIYPRKHDILKYQIKIGFLHRECRFLFNAFFRKLFFDMFLSLYSDVKQVLYFMNLELHIERHLEPSTLK